MPHAPSPSKSPPGKRQAAVAPVRLDDPARCRGCGEQSALRRGRCARCYERWLEARPVGEGASCAACSDRRLVHLRHFELHGLWIVLCHNCAARARALAALPRSVDKLLGALGRERRGDDRRSATPGETGWYEYVERRRRGRRAEDKVAPRRAFIEGVAGVEGASDGTQVIEMEAEFGIPVEEREPEDGPITDVHLKVDPSEL